VVLAEIGRRITSGLRSEDSAARIGGDEFFLLFEGVGVGHAKGLIDRLLTEIARPVAYDGVELTVTASAGIAIGNGATLTSAELVRRADIAMYEAKAAGRGRCRIYRLDMQSAAASSAPVDLDAKPGPAGNQVA
jgi:diguanylate cyclase (GGDEF)-like protein